MKTKERALVYGALAMLAVLNLAALLGVPHRVAVAAPVAADDLGPAGALTLVDGDDELVLKNGEGRLAWGDTAYTRAYSMAFVHIGPLMGELMAAEEYQEDRDALVEELQAIDEDYRERLNELGARVEALPPESPEAQELRAQGQRLLQEAQQWGLEAQQRQAALQATQMVSAYEELVAAVNVVAERVGIDVVFRYIPSEEPFENAGPDQVLTSIRLRTALRCPEEIDITPEVAEELGLEIE